MNKNKWSFRISRKDGSVKYAGTGEDSWFDIEDARDKTNYSKGEKIYSYFNCNKVGEAF